MPYGRLDIFYPDGKFESYILDVTTVSVGSASGNTIAIETDSISRYHFSITNKNGKIEITDLDSANGTVVDGVPLKSNQPYAILGDEEIQVGQIRMIFHPQDDSVTMAVPALDDTKPITGQSQSFMIALDAYDIQVWPASSSSAQLSILNTSKATARYVISVTGIPSEWLRMTRSELLIESQQHASVLINVKPMRRSDTVAKQYPVVIHVQRKDEPSDMQEVQLNVAVRTFSGIGVAVDTLRVNQGNRVRLLLHNHGNQQLELTASGWFGGATQMRFPSPILLEPGQRTQILADIGNSQRPLVGRAQERDFTVEIRSLDDARFLIPIEGRMTLTSRIPFWMIVTIAGIIVGLFFAVLFGATSGNLRTPEPEIAQFDLSHEFISQDETLVLTWSAEDAESFEVWVGDQLVLSELPPDAQSAEISLTDQSGDVSVSLVAKRGDNADESSRNVFVYFPMNVEMFRVTPETIIRNAVQNIQLEWNVPGAVSVQFSGLEQFTDAPVDSIYGAGGVIENIPGIAENDFTIGLIASDDSGQVVESSVSVVVIDPICMTVDGIELYEIPDSTSQIVGTIASEQAVRVEARDTSGGWLRTTLPGDVKAWIQVELLDCNDDFDPSALQTDLDIPFIPTVTPTSTPEPTITPVPSETPVPPTATSETETETPVPEASETATP